MVRSWIGILRFSYLQSGEGAMKQFQGAGLSLFTQDMALSPGEINPAAQNAYLTCLHEVSRSREHYIRARLTGESRAPFTIVNC